MGKNIYFNILSPVLLLEIIRSSVDAQKEIDIEFQGFLLRDWVFYENSIFVKVCASGCLQDFIRTLQFQREEAWDCPLGGRGGSPGPERGVGERADRKVAWGSGFHQSRQLPFPREVQGCWQAPNSSRSLRLEEMGSIGANLEPELSPGGQIRWRLHRGLCGDLIMNVWERREALPNGYNDWAKWEETQLSVLTLTHLTLWPTWQINSSNVSLARGKGEPRQPGVKDSPWPLISWVNIPLHRKTPGGIISLHASPLCLGQLPSWVSLLKDEAKLALTKREFGDSLYVSSKPFWFQWRSRHHLAWKALTQSFWLSPDIRLNNREFISETPTDGPFLTSLQVGSLSVDLLSIKKLGQWPISSGFIKV